MGIIKENFGKTSSGIDVDKFILSNANGIEVTIITYGATITSIIVPDKFGNFEDIVLGYDNISSYESGNKYFGAVIGRSANRIEKGRFMINGKEYRLAQNDNINHLHGGRVGFDKVVWKAERVDSAHNQLKLSYFSPDDEEGYPGNLKVSVTYTVTDDNKLIIDYEGICDKDTLVNLTNHSYFNLTGEGSKPILNHKLFINSDEYTPMDNNSIPIGYLSSVIDTPMDFKELKYIGSEIDSNFEQIQIGQGYDHNWMLNCKGDINTLASKLIDEASGRVLEVYTTKPAMQVYTANFLDGSDIGKGNVIYPRRSAVCLETQFVPNCINCDNFTSPVLKCGDKYNHCTIFKFGTLEN